MDAPPLSPGMTRRFRYVEYCRSNQLYAQRKNPLYSTLCLRTADMSPASPARECDACECLA